MIDEHFANTYTIITGSVVTWHATYVLKMLCGR